MKKTIYTEVDEVRLDIFLSEYLEDTSRAQIQELIKEGDVLVNNKKSKASYRLKTNDEILYKEIIKEEITLKAIDYPIDIVYEDDDIIVINKDSNIVVYPGSGKEEISVVSALLGLNKKLYDSEDKMRPGIVHRLDKDTSGLMVIVKNEKAYNSLHLQFKERSAIRKYYAIVSDKLEHSFGTIDAPIGRDERNRIKMSVVDDGRAAKTFFKTIKTFDDFSLVECELESGRTHQIRVHMKFIKHPVVNDALYGNKKSDINDNLLLQSYYLKFIHPTTLKEVEFELSLRDDLKSLVDKESL